MSARRSDEGDEYISATTVESNLIEQIRLPIAEQGTRFWPRDHRPCRKYSCVPYQQKVDSLSAEAKQQADAVGNAPANLKAALAGQQKKTLAKLMQANLALARCYECNPPTVVGVVEPSPFVNPCLAETIAANGALQAYQDEEHTLDTGGSNINKAGQATIVRLADSRYEAAELKLNQCLQAHGSKPDMSFILQGQATLNVISSSGGYGPFYEPITATANVLAPFWQAWAVSWIMPISVTYTVPTVGLTNTTTITLVWSAGGSNDPKTGSMTIQVKLHFHESLLNAGDDDATFFLSSENDGGSRMDAQGNVTLTGAGDFEGGYLGGGGAWATLTITAKATPVPQF